MTTYYHIEDRAGAVDYENDESYNSRETLKSVLELAREDSDLIFIAWGACPWRYRGAFNGFILTVFGTKCILEHYHDRQAYQIKPGMLKQYFH